MTAAADLLFTFDNTYARELVGLYEPWRPAGAPEPRLLVLNEQLAAELGIDPAQLRTPAGVDLLVGNAVPEGAEPIAQAYSGHQFGGFSPRLGDGRALLLGEVVDVGGRRRDLHLKGSGRTPFARGGDGLAAVGPMLREYVIGEAMHALGVPTTRALAVVATGGEVLRDSVLPGAVLARVASSHLRVGTFQFAAAHGDEALVRRLADYAIARHHPDAAGAENPYLALFERVVASQAALVSQWMLIGFIHGVMNTDNMTISGETIDYGPCAFMDAFDPATVFSSIDHGGRYAYGNQPIVAQWNLARLAEALIGLLGDDLDSARANAMAVLEGLPDDVNTRWLAGMRAKLGLDGEDPGDSDLVDDLLGLMRVQNVDYTSCLRALSGAVRGETFGPRHLFADPAPFDDWVARWRKRLDHADAEAQAAAMDAVNPVYIPRNHLVEEALAAATAGDLEPFHRLLDAVSHPYEERPGLERYAEPADGAFAASFRTFCGT